MFKLYEFATSGNCYKLRLAMSYLEIDFERIEIDITKGESRTSEFLKINSNGRVPVLETPERKYLPESNAALWYLSSETDLMPEDKFDQAKVLQWMFFEQYSHEPFIATSRYWMHILDQEEQYKNELEEKSPKGYAALDVMEQHLEMETFFVGNKFSAADITLYAYTHVANEGGFDLSKYTAINDWFSRVENVKNYVSINE
ncbi:MAG: glutathione S-transferase family protein [Pseudomonadales bacterium]|nr:glutathione S-transferase family protein [Pseudomonadales bacterium]